MYQKNILEITQEDAVNLITEWKNNLEKNLIACREAGYVSAEQQLEITTFVQAKIAAQEYAALRLESGQNPLQALEKSLVITCFKNQLLRPLAFAIGFLLCAGFSVGAALIVPGLLPLLLLSLVLLTISIGLFLEVAFVKERIPASITNLLDLLRKASTLTGPDYGICEALRVLSKNPSPTANNTPEGTTSTHHPSPLASPPKAKTDKPKILLAGPTFYEIKIDNPGKPSSESLYLRILEWNGDGLAAALDAHPKDFAEKMKLLMEKHHVNTLFLSLDKEKISDSRERQLIFRNAPNSLQGTLKLPTSANATRTGIQLQTIPKTCAALTTGSEYDYSQGGPPTPLYLTLDALYWDATDAPAFGLTYLLSNSKDKNTHFRACLEREKIVFGKGANAEPHPADHMVTVAPYLTNNPSEEEEKNPNIYGAFYRKRGEPVENARKITGQAIDFETGELVKNPSPPPVRPSS